MVSYPDPDEQDRVLAVLAHFDARLELEREEIDKLRRLKRGLARDLLTGRMRAGDPSAEGEEHAGA